MQIIQQGRDVVISDQHPLKTSLWPLTFGPQTRSKPSYLVLMKGPTSYLSIAEPNYNEFWQTSLRPMSNTQQSRATLSHKFPDWLGKLHNFWRIAQLNFWTEKHLYSSRHFIRYFLALPMSSEWSRFAIHSCAHEFLLCLVHPGVEVDGDKMSFLWTRLYTF